MEELAELLGRIFKLCVAVVIIGAVTLAAVVSLNLDKSLFSGWRLVRDDSAREASQSVADDNPPVAQSAERQVVKPVEEPIVEAAQQPEPAPQSYQRATPVIGINSNLQQVLPVRDQPVPVIRYNVVVVKTPKKHRWPRRFLGAIGHGLRKVVTFGH